jgi:hypothetical protein
MSQQKRSADKAALTGKSNLLEEVTLTFSFPFFDLDE